MPFIIAVTLLVPIAAMYLLHQYWTGALVPDTTAASDEPTPLIDDEPATTLRAA
jgi:hypothetical protein